MTTDVKPLRARDIMERDLITVGPETPILDVHRLFVEEEIHGAPVLDDDGYLCGVVSALDLLRAIRDAREPGAAMTSSTYFRDELPFSSSELADVAEDFQNRPQTLTAADVMTREVVMVPPDAPIGEVARTMLDQRIHRVLVGVDGSLDGLITTFDLLQVVRDVSPTASGHTGYGR
jgi:CBS domain-containing protein